MICPLPGGAWLAHSPMNREKFLPGKTKARQRKIARCLTKNSRAIRKNRVRLSCFCMRKNQVSCRSAGKTNRRIRYRRECSIPMAYGGKLVKRKKWETGKVYRFIMERFPFFTPKKGRIPPFLFADIYRKRTPIPIGGGLMLLANC